MLGNDVDTDQIIPAHHLVYNLDDPEERKLYGKFALSSVPMEKSGLPQGNIPFIQGENVTSDFNVIIGGSNFGCGSSREHAPVALNMAGVKVIIAESYARIFYRNSVDGGYLTPFETKTPLNTDIKTGDQVIVDTETHTITDLDTGKSFEMCSLGEVEEIVNAGGIFEYARKNKMISS